jgi:hypothetical protein
VFLCVGLEAAFGVQDQCGFAILMQNEEKSRFLLQE